VLGLIWDAFSSGVEGDVSRNCNISIT
jgi:hypothetical protein